QQRGPTAPHGDSPLRGSLVRASGGVYLRRRVRRGKPGGSPRVHGAGASMISLTGVPSLGSRFLSVSSVTNFWSWKARFVGNTVSSVTGKTQMSVPLWPAEYVFSGLFGSVCLSDEPVKRHSSLGSGLLVRWSMSVRSMGTRLASPSGPG